jgi:transposase
VWAGAAGERSVREASEDRPLNARGGDVGRDTQVPEVHRAAEARAGDGELARRAQHRRLCREHDISESLLRRWREQLLEAGAERLAAGEQRSQGAEQRRKIAELERALGRKTYELEIAGKLLRDWE